MEVERRDRAWPRDAVLVGELLDGRRCDPGRAKAVRAHPDRLGLPRLVEIGRAERLRVARAELEDVADLDRRLDADRVAVDHVAGLDAAHVASLEREVAAGVDAPQGGGLG